MNIRFPSRFHWLLLAALLAMLVRPDMVQACRSCQLVLAHPGAGEKDRNTECITLLVRGMMKSKSGAT